MRRCRKYIQFQGYCRGGIEVYAVLSRISNTTDTAKFSLSQQPYISCPSVMAVRFCELSEDVEAEIVRTI